MKKYLFLIMSFCLACQVFCLAAEEKVEEKNNTFGKVMDGLRAHRPDDTFLKTTTARSICAQLLTEAKNMDDSELRRNMIDYVCRGEKANKDKHSLYPRRSKNYELMEALIREIEISNNDLELFCDHLLSLYHPSDFKRISERVRTLFHKREGEGNSFLLYSYLPDNDAAKEMKFLDEKMRELYASYPDNQLPENDGARLHALRARFGDEKDEKWILDFFDRYTKDTNNSIGYFFFKKCMAIARTDKVIRKIADNIQDNGLAILSGDMMIERRKVYSQILERIYFDDPTFPHPDEAGNFDYDKVTSWCAKKFNITYPPKPTPKPMGTPTGTPVPVHPGGPFPV